MTSALMRRVDMPFEPLKSLDESWVQSLQDELEVFDPIQATLCDVHLREYYAHYGFNRLPEDVRYSAGMHWIDDTRLFLQYFKRNFSKGTIILVHGFTDHSGIYRPIIEHLVKSNWDVFTFDLKGHGLSSGETLGIHSFNQYVKHLQCLLDYYSCEFSGPVVFMGQSMGSSILLTLLQHATDKQKAAWAYKGAVFLAPLIRPTDYYWIRNVHRLTHWWLSRVKRRFSVSSHDADFLTFRSQLDPLQYRTISLSWVGALLRWIAEVETAQAFEDNMLIVQGTGDQTVNWRYNMGVMESLCPNAQLRLIRDARHHLVNEAEPYRGKVYKAIDAYLKTIR